jgi:hypothetical protein
MRMADPLAVAEAAKDALDRFGEVTICAEFGHGWSCTQPATQLDLRESSVGTTGAARCGCGGGGASSATGTTSKRRRPTGTSDAR